MRLTLARDTGKAFAQMFSTFINCGVKRKDANALSRMAPDNGRRLIRAFGAHQSAPSARAGGGIMARKRGVGVESGKNLRV